MFNITLYTTLFTSTLYQSPPFIPILIHYPTIQKITFNKKNDNTTQIVPEHVSLPCLNHSLTNGIPKIVTKHKLSNILIFKVRRSTTQGINNTPPMKNLQIISQITNP